MEKLFSKKNNPIIMLLCVVLIAIFGCVSDSLGGITNVPQFIANIVFDVAILGFVIANIITKKDKFLTLAILLLLPFVIEAFVGGFACLGYVDFEWDTSYGLVELFYGLGDIAVATGFILWVLYKFFGIKICDVAFLVVALFAIIFFIGYLISACTLDMGDVSTDMALNGVALIFEVIFFVAALYNEKA